MGAGQQLLGEDELGSILDACRTVTMVVAGDGTIMFARGGFGGFFDIDPEATVGTNVFDRLDPKDAEELASHFVQSADESAAAFALPAPFRLRVLDDDGLERYVDLIATGRFRSNDDWSWIVVLVPVNLTSSFSRPLELEMSGAGRAEVKKMLCEELTTDNIAYSSRAMLVEFTDELEGPRPTSIATSRNAEADLAKVLLAALQTGWQPWVTDDETGVGEIELDDAPPATRHAVEARGWRRLLIAPVHVQHRLRSAILVLTRVPESYPVDVVKRNIAGRVRALADATALLTERWDEQDRLRDELSIDPLTGLGNSRHLATQLDQGGVEPTAEGTMLFIDIDHFKDVNDTYGHRVGDDVLVTVADRILASCRHGDVVTRLGGDEFVVVLPGAVGDVAGDISQRILEHVSEPLEIADGPEYTSVSIGAAPLDGPDPLDSADQAMLRAKRAGRRRITSADGDHD